MRLAIQRGTPRVDNGSCRVGGWRAGQSFTPLETNGLGQRGALLGVRLVRPALAVVLVQRGIQVLRDALELERPDRLDSRQFHGVIDLLGDDAVRPSPGMEFLVVVTKP